MELATCSCRTRRQRRRLLQPRHRRQCATPADLHRQGRDKNPFAMLNVVQIQQPSKGLRTTALCCTWFRSTVDNSSSKRALHSFAISTVPPVFCVTQSGHSDVTAAATAGATLQLEISLLVTPFRTVDNLDTRMQHPRARPPFINLLAGRSQCHQGTPSTTARFQSAPFAISLSQNANATSSCSPIFAEPQQWPSLVAPLRDPSVVTSLGSCCAVTVAACCWLRCQKALTQTRN